MTTNIKTEIVIQTDTWASSFGDQMCAYMTGVYPNQYDEEHPGYEEANEFKNDPNISEKMKDFFAYSLEEIEGEHGPQYYEAIMTPGWFNHGMGGIYEDTPENEVIALADFKKVSTEYANDHYRGKELTRELEEIAKMDKVHKYSVEQGIWITWEQQLNQEQLEFLKKRAYEYAEKNDINILSFEADEVVINTQKTVKKLM
jgi:hypothetical protein